MLEIAKILSDFHTSLAILILRVPRERRYSSRGDSSRERDSSDYHDDHDTGRRNSRRRSPLSQGRRSPGRRSPLSQERNRERRDEQYEHGSQEDIRDRESPQARHTRQQDGRERERGGSRSYRDRDPDRDRDRDRHRDRDRDRGDDRGGSYRDRPRYFGVLRILTSLKLHAYVIMW